MRRGPCAGSAGLTRPTCRSGSLICALLLVLSKTNGAEPPDTELSLVDHLVYATTDLDAGIAAIEALTGIRAVAGGSHPGLGTRNALISLGPSSYLEIIAPDPAQVSYRSPRIFQIDAIDEPRLVTWAAKTSDVGRLADIVFADGQRVGAAASGEREQPDGATLRWQFTDPSKELANGIVPFFIDWGDSPHPAGNAPGGASLVSLAAEHPDPDGVRTMLEALGIDIEVTPAERPALIAILETPKGRVELR